jgi:transcriptional regulator with XRE-family HTH domain
MTVGERVKRLRLAKGWGPVRLADEAHVSRNTVHELETMSRVRPRAATVHLLAMALGATAAELLGLDDVASFGDEASARRSLGEAAEASQDLDVVPGLAAAGDVPLVVEPPGDLRE